MRQLVFASSNLGKIQEMKSMLPSEYTLLSLSDLGYLTEIKETGKTFEENAAIKADTIYEATGHISFADDSGLEVDALKKQPGVRSARYAGLPSDSAKNMALLLSNLAGVQNRKARFITVICLRNGSKTFFFEGKIEGKIAEAPRGKNGFGYDAIFIPDGYDKTFAEMDASEE